MKKLTKVLTILLIVLSLLSSSITVIITGAAPSTYSDSRNSGKRDEVCTTLSGTGASSYYTGSYTYDNLSTLSQSSLLQSLRQLMTSTHKYKSSYNDCKNYADETDCEGGNSSIITLYTSYASSQSEYDSGNGWNREHVWPKSLGGFQTSGAGADLHHIRPSENRTNGDRGSKKYGEVSGGSASKGNLSGDIGGYYSTYYEPLDNVKGDVARICLYVYVRWGGEYSKCNNITAVFQSVDVLLSWCALDPVDTWEMGRNEVVEKIQGNRNVFIDYPELAWKLFGRQAPSNMTTPSGEAAGGNAGGNTGGNTGGTTPPTTCTHSSTELRGVVSANCGKTGYTGDTYCKSCGVKVATGTVTSKVGSHIFGEWILVSGTQYKRICSVCQTPEYKNETCTHPSSEIIGATSASCGAAGYTGDTKCTSCQATLQSGTIIPKTGNHTFGEWELVSGTQYKHTCSVCFSIEYKNESCSHTSTSVKDAREADCAHEGYTGDTFCTLCLEIVERGIYTPRSGNHTFGEWELVSGTQYKHTCSTCGRVEHKREDCAHENTVLRDVQDASCSSHGYTGNTFCADCGYQTAYGEATPTAEHVFIITEMLKDASESSVGVARQECIVCGHSEITTTPPLKSGNNETVVIVAASAGGVVGLAALFFILKKLLMK